MANSADKINSILKVTGYWILFIVLLIPITSQSGATFPSHVHRFTFGIFGTVVALFVTWIFLKSENKSFVEYNLFWTKGTLYKFLKGLAIGIVSFSLITLILGMFAGLKIQKTTETINPWMWFWYLAILPAAFMEEIIFRSYPLLKLSRALGLRLTQLIISIAFALYHIPLGWSILTAFLGPGIWALIFGIAAIRSKGIALPTGIHVGLNLVLSILGMSHGVESFFVTSQSESTSNTIVNLITRIMVLLAGILLTEFYIRKSTKEITFR
jgi:membrane protease YdiL (CAAX protease family)